MSARNGETSPQRRGLVVLAAALLGALALTRGPTEAANGDVPPGFNPARQRTETVDLLRSIDARLARLVELGEGRSEGER